MSQPKPINSHPKLLLAFIALFILPISGLSVDIYIPSLPALTQAFRTDQASAQLTITVYMFALGLMQLFGGGITDSFGRKKPLVIGILVYLGASFCIPLVSTIHLLLFLRIVQGLMVGVIVVPTRSIIPDLFEGHQLRKLLNYMVVSWSMGPIIAPFLGGYLQYYIGWQANFYFLTIYSLIGLILVLFFLPETSIHRHPFQLLDVIKRYKTILFTWHCSSGMIISGLLYSVMIVFAAVAPFLMQNVMHYSAVQFGHISLLLGVCWFLGASINRFWLEVDLDLKAKRGLWLILLTAFLMVLAAISLPLSVYTLVVPVLAMTLTGAVIFPNYFARALSLFPTMTGSANALFGGLAFLIPSLSSGLATFLKSQSLLPLSGAYLGLAALCLMVYYSSVAKKA